MAGKISTSPKCSGMKKVAIVRLNPNASAGQLKTCTTYPRDGTIYLAWKAGKREVNSQTPLVPICPRHGASHWYGILSVVKTVV
ncbi:MAG: hypothetical protein OSB47_03245 [Pirellulaceae bacterium]|nr:hypothetical protein [Pirellulaceae bacterium]